LRTRILVLKSPRPAEKGILLVDYSFVFPLIPKFFDLSRIAERYHIVTEPSWSGYCDPNVLCYGINEFPVFVQASEPRDARLVDAMRTNLVPVGTSANWWIDHRAMKPMDVPKERDLVMVASWAKFKRHARFFAALAKLRARGRRVTVTLLGYPIDCTIKDISDEADYYGVRDQVEFHEWLRPDGVNFQMNRARINIVWSRREGVNRAIIEGMLADVPCIIRSGFNYGYAYPYVNSETGRFSTEESLPETILELLDTPREYSPRDWVMAHMSCQKATSVVAEAVRERALLDGETWTTDPVVKVGQLNTMAYWDPEDADRFEADYRFLESTLRRPA
jgi:glycosyltransferase involved in cell wall biosynthesis